MNNQFELNNQTYIKFQVTWLSSMEEYDTF